MFMLVWDGNASSSRSGSDDDGGDGIADAVFFVDYVFSRSWSRCPFIVAFGWLINFFKLNPSIPGHVITFLCLIHFCNVNTTGEKHIYVSIVLILFYCDLLILYNLSREHLVEGMVRPIIRLANFVCLNVLLFHFYDR